MRALFTLATALLLHPAKAQPGPVNTPHPLTTLGGFEKDHFIELDGSMSETLFLRFLQQVRTWSRVEAFNLSNTQLKAVINKLNELGEIKSLELNGLVLPDSNLQNARFSTKSLILSDCSLKDKNSSIHIPPATQVTLENTSAPMVLAVLRCNPGTRSLTVSNCDLSEEKELFKWIEERPLEQLSLTFCGLERLPLNIYKMQDLRSLDISSNNISLIDTTGIFKLSEFNCEDNPIAGLLQQHKTQKQNRLQPFSYGSPSDPFFLSQHPFLKPASTSYNVTPQCFELRSGTITTSGGARFKIPENVFVDARGHGVEGPVKVIVREYNSPQSIILAGIPMFMDTAGKKDYLVSDGMFEIQAYAGNEKLQLKPGEKIEVDYPSANRLTNGNQLYDLDPQTGSWNNISANAGFNGKALPRKDSLITRTRSKAVQRYQVLVRDFQTVNDATTYDERFNDQWHCGELLIDSCLIDENTGFDQVYAMNRSARAFLLQKRNTTVSNEPQTLVRLIPRERKSRRIYGPVSSLWWKVVDPLTKEEQAAIGHAFCDARFELDHDSTIALHLKDQTGLHTYHLEAFSFNNTKDVRSRAHRITRIMVDRQQKRNGTKAKTSHEIHTRYAGLSDKDCWRKIKKLRTKVERKMSFETFDRYALGNAGNGIYTDATSRRVAYEFSLTGLGLKNIDCRHTLSQPVDYVARTFDNDSIVQSYIYQPGANLLINFSGHNGSYARVMAESNKETYLVNVCNGEVSYAHYNRMDMKGMDPNETMCTPVKVPADQFSLEKIDSDLERLSPKVYPNPGTGIFSVSLPGYERFDIGVCSLNGRLVKAIKDYVPGSILDLGELNNGTYLLIIRTNGRNISSVKVTIQK